MSAVVLWAARAAFAGLYDFATEGDKYSYAYPYYVVNADSDCTLASATIIKVQDAVDDGQAISHADFLSAASGTFVKRGLGTLTIDEGLAAWTGDMHVMEGVMHVKHVDGFGPSAGANSVFVHDGATLLNENPPGVTKLDGNSYSCRRVLAFEGEGHQSMGALRVVNDAGGSSTWCLMCYPTLTGDGTLVLDNKNYVFLNWRPPAQLRLNRHKLTLRAAAGRTRPGFNLNNSANQVQVGTGVWAGEIVCDASAFVLSLNTQFDKVGEGRIVFTNKSSFVFSSSVSGDGTRIWPIDICDDLERWSLGNDNTKNDVFWCWDAAVTNQNNWDGPLYLGGNVRLYNALGTDYHHTGLSLNGPVSGAGGFRPYPNTNSKYYGDLALQLNHPGNTFTGGVVLGDGGRLIVRCNGALPAAGGTCSITNGSMILCGDDALVLPALEFHGTGLVARASWGNGLAARVTKSGAGALVWDACVGASEVQLKEGSLVYPPDIPDYSRVAGLLEYTNSYSHASFTNGVVYRVEDRKAVLSPLAAYNSNWRIPDPGGADDSGANNKIYSYRGYLWNQDSTNVTWSMVSVMDKGARVIVDGEVVVDQFNTDEAYSRNHAKTGAVTLTPGAHEFEFRYFCRSGNSGATGMGYGPTVFSYIDDEFFPTNSLGKHNNPAPGESGGLWTNNMGFGIDRQARLSHVHSDYEKAVDAGDGLLFTTSTNHADVVKPTPIFGSIVAAPGTVLELSGRDVALANLTGLPAVSNGMLTVSGVWTIPGADVAAGAKITGTGAFALDPAVQVGVADMALLPRGDFLLVATTGGNAFPASLNGRRLDARGRYRLVVSGSSLGIVYCCGTRLFLR